MSKKIKIGLVQFVGQKNDSTKEYRNTYKVEILEVFSNNMALVRPLQRLNGIYIKLSSDTPLVKMEDIKGIIEKEVSWWNYLWQNY